MLPGVIGCCQQGAGPSALSATIIDANDLEINGLLIPAGGASNPNEITAALSVSGGTTPYTFAWQLIERADTSGVFSPIQGTTDQPVYDDGLITNSALPPPNPAPNPGEYQVVCTITDNAGTQVQVDFAFNVISA